MAKETLVGISKGKLEIAFKGYKGPACFEEAKKIQQKLAELGVQVSIEDIIKTEEVNEQILPTKEKGVE